MRAEQLFIFSLNNNVKATVQTTDTDTVATMQDTTLPKKYLLGPDCEQSLMVNYKKSDGAFLTVSMYSICIWVKGIRTHIRTVPVTDL